MRRVGLVGVIVLVVLAALAPAGPLAPARVLAATPDLTLVSNARYEVLPDEQLVRVTVDLTATNRLADTKTRRYFFERAFLAVMPGTTGFRISSATGSPTVRVASKSAEHTMLRIDFGQQVGAGASAAFKLTFDLPDPGGDPARNLRVGPSLVSFPVWAFASEGTPGGSVVVVFPEGFRVNVRSGTLPAPRSDSSGRTIFSTGRLAAPLEFFAWFEADRPSALVETKRSVIVDGRSMDIVLRAWPEDPDWAGRVGGVLERGLPELGRQIGLPWGLGSQVIVEEVLGDESGGHSGLYDPSSGRIEVAYHAGEFVALHEAAHTWFDGTLLAERWANEGFSRLYASRAAGVLGIAVPPTEAAPPPTTPSSPAPPASPAASPGPAASPDPAASPAPVAPEPAPTTPDPSNPAYIPLNAWGPPGTGDPATDAYAYHASHTLARLIATRAGDRDMADVWAAVRERTAAYQPPPDREGPSTAAAAEGERIDEAPDWRTFLDILEDETGGSFDDLWGTWVVRPDDVPLLRVRAVARARYDELLTRSGEWRLPADVRQALRAWRFESADELMTSIDRTLDDRDAVVAAATAAGLTAPGTMQAAFEGQHGVAAAASEADAELAAIARYSAAAASRPVEPDLFQRVGVMGVDPAAELDRAARAFARGDLGESASSAELARAVWSTAGDVGRNRLLSIASAIGALLLAITLMIGRRRRGRANRPAHAHRSTVTDQGRTT